MMSLGVLFSLPEKLVTCEMFERDEFLEIERSLRAAGEAVAYSEIVSLLLSASDAMLPYASSSSSLQAGSFAFSDACFTVVDVFSGGDLLSAATGSRN